MATPFAAAPPLTPGMPGVVPAKTSYSFSAIVQRNPGTTALLIGGLVVVVLLLVGRLNRENRGWWGRRSRFVAAAPATVPGAPPPSGMPCGKLWDPAASAELMALTVAGGVSSDHYGEKALQDGIDAAFDSDGLSDQQIMMLAHHGN